MGAGGGIPADVRSFVQAHLQSIGQLELLLRLYETPDRAYTATELSRELRTSERAVFTQLTELFGAGVVTVDDTDVPRWRFHRSGRHAGSVDELAEAVRHRKRAVHDLILSGPNDDVRVFSDAFRLRKDKP